MTDNCFTNQDYEKYIILGENIGLVIKCNHIKTYLFVGQKDVISGLNDTTEV